MDVPAIETTEVPRESPTDTKTKWIANGASIEVRAGGGRGRARARQGRGGADERAGAASAISLDGFVRFDVGLFAA